MTEPPLFLSMRLFLNTVAEHGGSACTLLVEDGFHPKVVLAKALKASRRGYVDYGTSPWGCWITPRGLLFLCQRLPVVGDGPGPVLAEAFSGRVWQWPELSVPADSVHA